MSVKITLVSDRVFLSTWQACSLILSFKNVAVTLRFIENGNGHMIISGFGKDRNLSLKWIWKRVEIYVGITKKNQVISKQKQTHDHSFKDLKINSRYRSCRYWGVVMMLMNKEKAHNKESTILLCFKVLNFRRIFLLFPSKIIVKTCGIIITLIKKYSPGSNLI